MINKPRLFLDLDGTATEWRNINLELEENEDAESTAKKLFDILQIPGYFYSLEPNEYVVAAIQELIQKNEIEVFSLTCYPEDGYNSSPKKEKNMWQDKFISKLDNIHRIYVPYGACKNDYVPGGIRKTDTLFDDKTSNLTDFENGGGKGIKFLNGVNSTYGTWNGTRISIMRTTSELVNALENIILHDKNIKDDIPPKKVNEFDYNTFDFNQAVEEMNSIYLYEGEEYE